MKKYTYLPGVLLIVIGLVRATMDLTWSRAELWLAGAGLLVVAISIVANLREVREWLGDPRGVFAVNTSISFALLVGILVLVNLLAAQKDVRADLTTSGRNTVGAETRAILARLDRDVSLRQFGRTHDPEIDQLLAAVHAAGSRLRVEFVDAERQPRETQKYGVLKAGTVVVASGEKFRKVENPTEQGLVTAVLQVTADVERTLCFVTGHGEHGVEDTTAKGLSRLVANLEASNFKTDRVSLLEAEVPRSCSALVLAGPARDLTPEEYERLTEFANQGGIAILLDPAPAPGLQPWLANWNIRPGNGVVIDQSGAGQSVGTGPQTPLALGYGDHPIARGFEIATIYDWARPIETTTGGLFGGKPVTLAQTSARSFEETELKENMAKYDEGKDRRGPLALGVATSVRLRAREEGPHEARLVVFGDSDFVSNAFIGRQGNRDFFLRVASWLAGESDATIVRVEEKANRRVELTERDRLLMYVVNIGLLPLIPLVGGLVAFLRAKR